ncbi:TspO/MBR family protein [Enterovirga aerilata]|uniref:TspO/MBR family protein n=1 Tax=Enterovirga aerilata TaxID=2730920 RepID=UPI001FED50F6|nr:TspO/MBR family protein [Enterovirga sp. DB1703]
MGRLALAILPVALVSVLGSWATLPNIPTWYAGLAKPPLTPPNGVFGPVWTALYGLMAFAIWRVLSTHPAMPGRGRAVALFYLQLALNGLWSWSFFAAQSPAAGLANILALDVAAGATFAMFRRIDRLASWCLLPYLAWIAFATYLNAEIWLLNG